MPKINIELYIKNDECVFYSYESFIIPRKDEFIFLNGVIYIIMEIIYNLSNPETVQVMIKEQC